MTHATYSNPRPQFQPRSQYDLPVAGAPQVKASHIFDAVVTDVIVNEEHPEFLSDGYNVGCIQFRAMDSEFYVATENLHWALPIDTTIAEYPLLNEIVRIFPAANKIYYTRKINIGNHPSHQAMFNLEREMGPLETPGEQSERMINSEHTPSDASTPQDKLGNYYHIDSNIRRLRHWEGDTIFEGRMGQTIRFGTSWKNAVVHKEIFQALGIDQSPNILIRVGQSPDAVPTAVEFGTITEDINKDKSSIWMVTDQVVPLIPATSNDAAVHMRSVRNPPSPYAGNQVIINSNRLVINSKTEKILMYSATGIHLNTLQDTTLDMGGDYVSYVGGQNAVEIVADEVQNVGRDSILWYGQDSVKQVTRNYMMYVGGEAHIDSKDKISLVSKKIFIGSVNKTEEPMVLGKSLVKALIKFIDAHVVNQATHVTSIVVGPSFLNPAIVTALKTLRDELEEMILSKDNFVSKTNTAPVAPPARHMIHPRPTR